MIKLSDYVMDFVAGLGVKHVFMLPGGGCMHLVDSLGRSKRLKCVGYLHEQAAAIAADAYAQYRGDVGVALVTTGPGGTNAITAVTASWIDSTPVMVLSGQVKTVDLLAGTGLRQRGIQEADIIQMVKPVTKYAVTVTKPSEIRYHLEKAVWLARNGRRGPVWIDLPLDMQGAKIDPRRLKGFKPPKRAAPPADSRAVLRAIALLNKAGRPVILAGAGIRMAGAQREFLALARRLGVPVLTTWRAADFMAENDPLYFGRPGSIAGRAANFIQQNSDFIMAVGARLDLPQVGHNYDKFARGAKKVVVDIDPAEIRKLAMKVDVKAPCDAGDFIRKFSRSIARVRKVDRSGWLARCRKWKKDFPPGSGVPGPKRGLVNTYDLIEELSRRMNSRDVLVPGSSGACAEVTMQAVKVRRGQRILNTPGLGSMGFGLPAGAGAAIAAAGRRVITIIGDGGLQHNIQAYETIRRLNLPVKVFILNNNGYGSIRLMQSKHFKGNYVCCDPASGLTMPDITRNAAVYGLKTLRITGKAGLRSGVKKVLASKGPVVCEVMADPWLETAPKISSFVKPDGSIVSKPLEDMWPFLDREEFRANMIVEPVKE